MGKERISTAESIREPIDKTIQPKGSAACGIAGSVGHGFKGVKARIGNHGNHSPWSGTERLRGIVGS